MHKSFLSVWLCALLCLLSGGDGSVGVSGLSVTSSRWDARNLDLQSNGQYQVAIFQLTFDSDVFIKTADGQVHPISDFQGGTADQQDQNYMPNILQIGGTAKLECGSKTFESYGQFQNGPPLFLLPAPPTSDPAPSFLASIGGFSLPDTWITNKMAFILILQGGGGGGGMFTNLDLNTLQSCNPALVFPGDVDSRWNLSPGVVVSDSQGNAFSGSVSLGSQAPPRCTLAGMQSMVLAVNDFVQFVANVSNTAQLNQLGFAWGMFTVREAYVGCLQLARSFVDIEQNTEVVNVTASSGCVDPPGSQAFSVDPCCNGTLADTMCCAAEPGATAAVKTAPKQASQVVWQLSGLDSQNIGSTCAHPDSVALVLADFARLEGLVQQQRQIGSAGNGGANSWNEYFQFWQKCQTLVFQQSCTLNSDCVYSGLCNAQSGTCMVTPDNQNEVFAQCILAQMPHDVNYELSMIWGVGNDFATRAAKAAAFAAQFRDRCYSLDCVGPDAWSYQSQWKTVVDAQGNFQQVFQPGNETGCLSVKGCTWNGWDRSMTPDKCAGPQTLEFYGPNFCGSQNVGTYNDVMAPPMCMVFPANASSCTPQNGLLPTPPVFGGSQCVRPAANSQATCYSSPLCVAVNASLTVALKNGTWTPQSQPWDWRCQWNSCYFNRSVVPDSASCSARASALRSGNALAQKMAQSLQWDAELQTCYAQMWPFSLAEQVPATCLTADPASLWSEARQFYPGQWASEQQCSSGQCSIQRLSFYGVTAERCAANFYCTQPCSLCTTWQTDALGNERTLCYSPTQTQNECANPGQWNSNLCYSPTENGADNQCNSRCVYPYTDRASCVGNGLVWRECGDLNNTICPVWEQQGQFGGGTVGNAPWEYLYLGCQWSTNAECETPQQCLAAGQCNDWELSRCDWSTQPPTCSPGSCVTPFQQNPGGGGRQCPQGGSWQWSQMGCVNAAITNETACLKQPGATWQKAATSQSGCAAHSSQCVTQYQFSDRDSEQCADCGGSVKPVYTWTAGVPLPGQQMPLFWGVRNWTSVNSWQNTLDFNKLSNEIQIAIGAIVGRQMLNQMNAQLFLTLPTLQVLACDCTDGGSNRNSCFDPAQMVDVTCRADPAIANQCDGLLGTVLFSNDSVQTSNATSLLLSTLAIMPGQACAQRAASRSNLALLASGDGGSAGPYAVVENELGAVVGQLVGGGYTIPAADGLAFPLSTCLSRDASIPQDLSTYPTLDFAGDSSGTAVGLPMDIAVTSNGVQYCASVPSPGTYYPIRRQNDWKTALPTPSTTSIWTWNWWQILVVCAGGLLVVVTAACLYKYQQQAKANKSTIELTATSDYADRALHATTV
jgi:hypothetical protein